MRRHAEQINNRRALWLTAPALCWIATLFLGPLLLITGISFSSRGAFGELELPLTYSNYQRVLGFGFLGWEATYPVLLLRSLVLAAATMVLCLLLGGPMAFFIARLPNQYKTCALTLVVIPLWTNLLIRTYAWQLLLEPNGWIARTATALGALKASEGLYPGTGAVLTGMVCDYLPFLVLPLYASVERIDWTLAEAARDLGASGWRLFYHAILPQITPGMAAGLVLVFVPAIGQFVIPDLLGGSKTALLGNVVQQQFGSSRDWPFGSALGTVAMGVVLATLWFQARVTRRKGAGSEL